MIEQIKSILKMRSSKILFLLFIILNIFSSENLSGNSINPSNELTQLIEETIAVKTRFEHLRTVYKQESENDWDNFFQYCNWKIKYLSDLKKLIAEHGFNQDEYYKSLLIISSIDLNLYANQRIGDYTFDHIKTNEWDYYTKISFNPNRLNKIYYRANTVQFIHQCYINELSKLKLLYQRVKYDLYIDNSSFLGSLITKLKADSMFSFLTPILLIIYTISILSIFKQNSLYQLHITLSSSRQKYVLNLALSIILSFIVIYTLSFFIVNVFLLIQKQHTTFNTSILVDQTNLYNFSSYSHSHEKMYYMGNEYFASAITLYTIPECMKLMEIKNVFNLAFSMDFFKMIFYTILSMLIFFAFYHKDKLQKMFTVFMILIYSISQFSLIAPRINPLAIISSFSIICGGYEITWLYGIILLFISICLIYMILLKTIRKVDL